MHADLEHVIALQKIDSETHDAERRLADEPERLKALDAKLEESREKVAAAKAALTANQTGRRNLEKEIAVHQGRLSKFREQAMAVKTNQEYHAIQHEIAFAQGEIKKLEDSELELMVEGDELAATVKRAEAAVVADQKSVEADKKALAVENANLKSLVTKLHADRASVASSLPREALATFEMVSKRRNGLAVAEAKDGICTICHVRLRPQVFNTVRRNESIIQCDSCQRILFFVPPPAGASAGTTPAPAAP